MTNTDNTKETGAPAADAVAAKPKRRTKAQIEADNAAALAARRRSRVLQERHLGRQKRPFDANGRGGNAQGQRARQTSDADAAAT
jgi:hypothetical protein